MTDMERSYTPSAVKEVSFLPQSMLATSLLVETLGERKGDMKWANSLRNGPTGVEVSGGPPPKKKKRSISLSLIILSTELKQITRASLAFTSGR